MSDLPVLRRTRGNRRRPASQLVDDTVAESLTYHEHVSLSHAVDEYRAGHATRRGFIASSFALGVSATSLSTLLAACGSPSNEKGATGGGSQKLAVGVNADMDTVDPQAFKTIPAYFTMANVYDQLIDNKRSVVDGNVVADGAVPAPMIADTMEASADRTTFRFALNPKASFADGTPITAEDVVYTFQRGIEGKQYTATIMSMLALSSADNIRVVDPHTLEFKLDKPNPMAERLLSSQVVSILSKAVGEANATAEDEWASEYWRNNLSANGAYTLKSWNRGEGWELAPNPRYYRAGLPKNGGVVFRVVADPQERLNLLRTGTLNVAYDIPTKDAVGIRDGDAETARLVSVPSPWAFALAFTNTVKPLDDKRVRQALSYAVPYDDIIANVMHRLARLSKGPVPPGMSTHDPSIWGYQTDLAKAKQLLEAAGHGDGFSSTIEVLIGRPEDEQAATLIQANFREIGVNVDVAKLSEAQYQDHRVKGTAPMQIVEWFSWVNDPFYHLFFNYLSTNAGTNSARYANKRVDKLITDGLYEIDEAKRASMSAEAQKLIIDDAPWAFLFVRDFYAAVSANFRDFPIWPDLNPRFYWSSLA